MEELRQVLVEMNKMTLQGILPLNACILFGTDIMLYYLSRVCPCTRGTTQESQCGEPWLPKGSVTDDQPQLNVLLSKVFVQTIFHIDFNPKPIS